MATVVDDATTLPRFHAWQHRLDQPQSTEVVHFEQFFGHIDWDTLQHGQQS